LLLSLISKYSSISISLSNSINVVKINVKDELGFRLNCVCWFINDWKAGFKSNSFILLDCLSMPNRCTDDKMVLMKENRR